jgi:protocatechuate 3,4-dioxygenase, beta subunit
MRDFDRRHFLGTGLGATAAWLLVGARAADAANPCQNAPPHIIIATDSEPGDRLEVSGQVFRPDGVTAAAGVTLYVYQTDAKGLYNTIPGSPPRLRGWMTTDRDGRYGYRTIRPAPYPAGTIAAHIHTQLWGGGAATQWNEELLFEDDRLVDAAQRKQSEQAGRFAWVRRAVKGPDGILRCTQDIKLKAHADRFEGNIMHGLSACGRES